MMIRKQKKAGIRKVMMIMNLPPTTVITIRKRAVKMKMMLKTKIPKRHQQQSKKVLMKKYLGKRMSLLNQVISTETIEV